MDDSRHADEHACGLYDVRYMIDAMADHHSRTLVPDAKEPCPVATPDAPAAADRRRPGRPESVSPELIPLLRNAASVEIPEQDAHLDAPRDNHRDDMGPARGLAVALLIVAPFWCAVLGLWWLALR